jgi:hypothetical protein
MPVPSKNAALVRAKALRSPTVKMVRHYLVEVRGDREAYALNVKTSAVYSFTGLESRVVSRISAAGRSGLPLAELLAAFPRRHEAVRGILAELAAGKMIREIPGLPAAGKPRRALVVAAIPGTPALYEFADALT